MNAFRALLCLGLTFTVGAFALPADAAQPTKKWSINMSPGTTSFGERARGDLRHRDARLPQALVAFDDVFRMRTLAAIRGGSMRILPRDRRRNSLLSNICAASKWRAQPIGY